MRFHREIFFDRFRQEFGKLSQNQVDGLNFLLDKLEKDTFTLEQAAYVLATTKHETGHTFQPVREKRARPGTRVRQLQDRYWGSGFFGRGYVQLTHKENYKKAGESLGLDLVNQPDLALEPEAAYQIMAAGMREGWFTGKKISDYVD